MGWIEDNIPVIGDIYKGVKNFVKGVVSIFTGGFGVNLDSPDYSSNEAETIQGVLVNKDSAIADIPVVYGTRAVGAARVFVSTGAGSNEYLYVAYVLAEGQVNGYTQLKIDDNTVTVADYSHGVRALATSGNYATDSRLEVQFFDGRDDQIASTLLQEAPGWTANHKLSGLAYLACKFRWKKIESEADANNNPYGGGVPVVVVTLQGKKIFDITGAAQPITYGTITQAQDLSGSIYQQTPYTISADGQTVTNNPGPFTVSSHLSGGSPGITFTTSRSDSKVRIRYGGTFAFPLNATGRNTVTIDGFVSIRTGLSAGTEIKQFNINKVFHATGGSVTGFIDETLSVPTGTYYIFNQLQLRVYGQVFSFITDSFTQLQGTWTRGMEVNLIGPPISTDIVPYASHTTVYSDNPVNILLDYMRNPRYGKGLSNDVFDFDSWRTAAKLCNQVVTYTDSTTGKAFTCNAVIDTGVTLMDNIRSILVTFRGMMPYQQGKYVLKIEHGGDDTDITATPASPVVVFSANNDNIIGGINITGDSKVSKINRCKVVWTDPAADYQPNEVIYPDDGSATDIQYLAEDGIRLEKDITLPMITVREQALQAARVFVERSRNFKQISCVCTMAGSSLTVGDLFRVTNERLGLDGTFRVTEMTIGEQGDIQISGFEHRSAAYAIEAKEPDITRPTLTLPDPMLVVAPTAVTATSGAAQNVATGGGYLAADGTLRRILVSWTASTDPFVSEYIIQFKLQADADYVTAGITNLTTFFIQPVTLGSVYNIRVAARNELDRRSNFANAAAHTVVA